MAGDEKNDLLYLPVIRVVGGECINSFFEKNETGKNGGGATGKCEGIILRQGKGPKNLLNLPDFFYQFFILFSYFKYFI